MHKKNAEANTMVYDLNQKTCRPSTNWHSCMPGSRKREMTWKSRLLRETSFTLTCARYWKDLQKLVQQEQER